MEYNKKITSIFKKYSLSLFLENENLLQEVPELLRTQKEDLLLIINQSNNIDRINEEIDININKYLKSLNSLTYTFKNIYIYLLTVGNNIKLDKYQRLSKIVKYLSSLLSLNNFKVNYDDLSFENYYDKIITILEQDANYDCLLITELKKHQIKELEELTDYYNYYPETIIELVSDIISSLINIEVLEINPNDPFDINKLIYHIQKIMLDIENQENIFKIENYIVATNVLDIYLQILEQSLTLNVIDQKTFNYVENQINSFKNKPKNEEELEKITIYRLLSNNIPA